MRPLTQWREGRAFSKDVLYAVLAIRSVTQQAAVRGSGIVRRQLAASRFAHRKDTRCQTARKRVQLGAPWRGIDDLDASPEVRRIEIDLADLDLEL